MERIVTLKEQLTDVLNNDQLDYDYQTNINQIYMKQASKGIEGTSIEKGRVLPQDNTQAYSENQEKLMDDMNLEKKTSLNRTYNHISEIDYNVTKADNKSPIMKKPIINEMPKATSKSQQRLKSFVDLRVLPGLAFIRKVKQANIDM